ncbi:hypothetical protein F2Q70_00023101 [Brassica cretica]|uniref:Uncharacterized protein n=1 Tax=Brassica cretica TaxID=69181 RepID=A0A8S9GRH3_BRACR|nr:hypothetical protein F2Q70_00023101 [Brassica cretica]
MPGLTLLAQLQGIGKIWEVAPLHQAQKFHQTSPGVIRFYFELAVDDSHNSATFVTNGGGGSRATKMPRRTSCGSNVCSKFASRVTPYNYTPNFRTFTVSASTENVVLNTQSEVG